MHLAANVFDVWVFQRRAEGVVFLLLHTSVEKAARHFNGGRFWQIPSDSVRDDESITDAIGRALDRHGLRPRRIWAGEHAYLIFRGLKDGLRSVHEYITSAKDPARELCLFDSPGG